MRIGIHCLLILFMSSMGWSVSEDGSYGFVGGVSVFNQSIKSSSGAINNSSSFDIGYHVGVFGEFFLARALALTPGVYLSQKGARANNASRQASYLETAALLRWYFADSSTWRSYLGFGSSFGILLSAQDTTNTGIQSDKFRFFSKNDLSAQVGWGLEFPVSSGTGMQIGLTYSRSLTTFIDPGAVGGDKGTWSGFYGFLALRFKSQVDYQTPEERARDYLRFRGARPPEKEASTETEEL